MTIKSIELFNFEGHKASILDFVPGVNIITGLSGHGKSMIVRGFNWGIKNFPSGESMLSYTSEGICSSEIIFSDDRGIARSRGDNINEYYLTETDETFKALRGKVPEAISNLADMDEVNIQRQRDFYFMLDDSPGQVAKMFNKVSGLEEMDSAMTTINKMYRECKKEYTKFIDLRKDLDSRLEYIEWINQADSDFSKIETVTATVEKAEDEIGTLEDLISSIHSVQKEIDSCQDTSAIPRIDTIFSKEDECNSVESEYENITKLLDSILQVKNDLNNIRVPDKERLVSLTSIAHEIEEIKDEIAGINLHIEKIDEYENTVFDVNGSLAGLKHEHAELLVEHGVCPTCGKRV